MITLLYFYNIDHNQSVSMYPTGVDLPSSMLSQNREI